MTLLLDIGNTRIKWGWLESGCVRAGAAAAHYGNPAQALTGWNTGKRPQRVFAVSVAGYAVTAAVVRWVKDHWGIDVRLIRASAAAAGVRSGYADPGQLGADRWVAVIGAYHLSGTAACVVDCGSALTLDAVDANGRHRGGLIAPGWQLMRAALHRGTAELPLADTDSVHLFATDTAAAIASGTLLGAAAMIEQLSGRMVAEIGGEVALWLTGGGAPALLPYLQPAFVHAPQLVLQGLAVLADEC